MEEMMLRLNAFSNNHHPTWVKMLAKYIRHGISVINIITSHSSTSCLEEMHMLTNASDVLIHVPSTSKYASGVLLQAAGFSAVFQGSLPSESTRNFTPVSLSEINPTLWLFLTVQGRSLLTTAHPSQQI
jgi:hypothetical protein